MSRPLLVAHDAAPGGMGELMLSLFEHRPPSVEPAFVFLTAGPIEERARAAGALTAVVPSGRGREVWRVPSVIGSLRGAIRAHRADVVFAHHTKAQLYAAPAARLEGLPNVWWRHALIGQQPLLDAVVHRLPTDLVVTSADHLADRQRRATPGPPVVAVHPGTRVPAGPLATVRPDGRTIGIVGRLQRWKRVEALLRAVPAILAAEPATRVRVLGDAGPGIDEDYPDELRRLAGELAITEAVAFEGHVPGAADRIPELDVLVHTAAEEPFGLVLVEAMVRGVPVVAPREGGPLEIVRDGVDGVLVDVEDAEALAGAVVALLRDPDRRARLGVAGRERVEQCFTDERMAARAWELVEGVAAGR